VAFQASDFGESLVLETAPNVPDVCTYRLLEIFEVFVGLSLCRTSSAALHDIESRLHRHEACHGHGGRRWGDHEREVYVCRDARGNPVCESESLAAQRAQVPVSPVERVKI
jgi:hypothetical protein